MWHSLKNVKQNKKGFTSSGISPRHLSIASLYQRLAQDCVQIHAMVTPTCRPAEQSGPLLFPTSWSQHLPSFPDHHHHLGDQHVRWSNVEHCGSSDDGDSLYHLMVEKLGFPIQPKPRQQLAQDLLRLLCIINCEVVLLHDPLDYQNMDCVSSFTKFLYAAESVASTPCH